MLAPDVRGTAKGPQNRGDGVPLAHGAELHGGGADCLANQGDGPPRGIRVRNCQRNPLPKFGVNHQDDKLPGLSLAGNQGSLDFEQEDALGKGSLFQYLVHGPIIWQFRRRLPRIMGKVRSAEVPLLVM